MVTHQLALAAGYRLEHFQIERVLGKGGFGITYVAIDTQLGKRVAIKELLPDSIATRIEGVTVVPQSSSLRENWDWACERFREEARILAGFSHPAIVDVHRLIEANGTVYMVMDFIDGESYEARLRRIGKEPDQASLMAVMGPILDGLQEVHAQSLLHRDIKPENILISSRGQPVLIDFGSARSSLGATMTMTSIVTHGYSPIEQYQTKGRMGPWTDVYALGAVMCRAITGEKPLVATDRIEVDEHRLLSTSCHKNFSHEFLLGVDKALCVKTDDRPRSLLEWQSILLNLSSNAQLVKELEKSSAPTHNKNSNIDLDSENELKRISISNSRNSSSKSSIYFNRNFLLISAISVVAICLFIFSHFEFSLKKIIPNLSPNKSRSIEFIQPTKKEAPPHNGDSVDHASSSPPESALDKAAPPNYEDQSSSKMFPIEESSKQTNVVQKMRVPFNFKWGESMARVKKSLNSVNARVIEKKIIKDKLVLVVEGIPQKNLLRSLFYFSNDKLNEIELHYGDESWDSLRYARFFDEVRLNVDEKYGKGKMVAREKKQDQNNVINTFIGYQWVQGNMALRLFLFTGEKEDMAFQTLSLHYKLITM
jgi:serine/threonine protein kinase